MSVWKYLVLIGGILGVAGFFLAFVAVRTPDGRFKRTPSAYQAVRGLEEMDAMAQEMEKLGVPKSDAAKFAKQAHDNLELIQTAASAMYLPAALLALLGIVCGLRRKMGRIAGLFSLVLGLVSAGIWLLFLRASLEDHDANATLGAGAHALLVAGAAGIIAGLGALIAPDRGSD